MQKAKHIDIWLIFDKTFVMRTLFLFIFSLLALCPKLFAQTVFAPKGAVWNYYLDSDGIGSNFKYEVEKDTIYGGRLCSKINSKRVNKTSTTTLSPVYFCTSGDTVLYYHDSLKSFTPLYIFNVKVGDTLTLAAPRFTAPYLDTARFRVKKIDTTIIDGLSLRTVHTEPVDYHYFMNKYTERIGAYSVANIFGFDGVKTAMHTEGIRCYRDKAIEEQFYIDKWDCDYVPNYIEEKSWADNIRIFPNPLNEKLNIRFDKSIIGEIQVSGIDGRILNQKAIEGNEIHIDMSSLTNGLYYLQIKTAQETFSRLISVLH